MDKAYVSRVIRVLDHPEAELFYRWQVTELNKLSPPGISALGGIPAADIALRNICIYALSHLQNKEVRNTVGGLFSVTRHWQEEIVARLMTHPSVEAFDFGMQLALSSGSHVSWKPDNTISLVEEYGGAVSVARAAGRLNTLINGDFAKWTSEAELLYRLCSLSDAHRIQDVIAKATPYRPER